MTYQTTHTHVTAARRPALCAVWVAGMAWLIQYWMARSRGVSREGVAVRSRSSQEKRRAVTLTSFSQELVEQPPWKWSWTRSCWPAIPAL